MTRTEIVALTLLHFLWQGALIHGLLVLLFRVTRHSDANVRYGMGVVALVLMALAPIITGMALATSGQNSATFASSFTAQSTADANTALNPVRLANREQAPQSGAGVVSVPVRRVM